MIKVMEKGPCNTKFFISWTVLMPVYSCGYAYMKKQFGAIGKDQNWNRLPREAMEALSLKVFKPWLGQDKALKCLVLIHCWIWSGQYSGFRHLFSHLSHYLISRLEQLLLRPWHLYCVLVGGLSYFRSYLVLSAGPNITIRDMVWGCVRFSYSPGPLWEAGCIWWMSGAEVQCPPKGSFFMHIKKEPMCSQ